MKANKKYLSLLFVPFVLTSCNDTGGLRKIEAKALNEVNKPVNEYVEHVDSRYLSSLFGFSESFYKYITGKENTIFSPLSISTCFSLAYEGASNASKEELASLLNYQEDLDYKLFIQDALKATSKEGQDYEGNTTYITDVSQAYFLDNSFLDYVNTNYLKTLQDYYYADAFAGELASEEMHEVLANYINEKTHDFLKVDKKQFEDLKGVLWLLNTVYLKARWEYRFLDTNDQKGGFINLDGSETRLTYMRSSYDARALVKEKYTIVSLPLKGGLSLNVLMGNKIDSGLINDEAALNDLFYFKGNKSTDTYELTLKMPPFKIMEKYDLKKIFIENGYKNIFDPDNADFSKMTIDGQKGLYINGANHCAGIDVSREGVEAAAYTILEMAGSAAPVEHKTLEFNMDHPFIFTLTERHDIPLFMGQVTKL